MDDTVAVQQAVDAAAARGVGVRLGANTSYVMSGALNLPSGTRLTGAGKTSVLRFTWRYNDARRDGYYLGNRDQVRAGNSDITLRSFAIRGAATGLPAGANDTHHKPRVPAIRFRLVDRFVISQLDIGYAPGISIIYQGSSDGLISRNRIHHSGRDGINGTWHRRNLHDIRITMNRISKIGDDGIAVIGTPGGRANLRALPYGILIDDNVIHGWPRDPNGQLLGRGITIMAATHVGVVGNRIDTTHSAGILVAPSTRAFSVNPATGLPWRSSDVSIVDNVVIEAGRSSRSALEPEDTGRGGVVAKSATRLRVAGNTVERSHGRHIALYDCRACVVGEDQ
jgi:hypothetical protein